MMPREETDLEAVSKGLSRNRSIIISGIALASAGIIGTSWIKSKVENAGYVSWHEMSGVSPIFRSLVYTKDMAICEDLVAAKYRHRK
jgi:hypothetical protein